MRLSRERLALVSALAGLAGVTVVASADAATPGPAQTAQSVSPTTAPRLAPTQIAIDPSTKLTELVSPSGVLVSVKKGDAIKMTARRATPGVCEEVRPTRCERDMLSRSA